jgi:Ca2+-binding RTX toxin-like protein
MSRSAPVSLRRPRRLYAKTKRRSAAVVASFAVVTTFFAPASVPAASAAVGPVGSGFSVTPGDLSFILKQIKIAERHSFTLSAGNPCGTLVNQPGDGIPDAQQVPDRLTSFGLRTVDGSCNNLFPGRENFAGADQPFPRLTNPRFRDAEPITAELPVGAPGPTSYKQKKGSVVDSQPRLISNLIVDQTSHNPAAVSAAEFPVRTQGNPGLHPCTTDPDPSTGLGGLPAGCVPTGKTLFIPNVTTDVGLSPPYSSMFTFFGQFFDHGVDQTVKSGATVFVPLKADDPLIAGNDAIPGTADDPKAGDPNFVPASQRFMVLTRAQNQPGPDGVLGDNPATAADESADDVQNANNTDSPWVDQSQTYTSHASHQVFLRDYDMAAGKPVANGKLLGGIVKDDPLPCGATPCYNDGAATTGSISTWAATKQQAAEKLGMRLEDKDVLNVPMIATDPYGEFLPGPNGLPQYVTKTGLVEGNLANPVPVPANVRYFDTPFLTDIAHNADPSNQDLDHNGSLETVPVPDADSVASADFASQKPGTYDDEMLADHFTCGDGRCNENIALTAIHQVFHHEHDRLVDDIQSTLDDPVNAALSTAFHATNTGTTDPNLETWTYGDRLFQAARFVTEMEYQHLVFEEFGRKVQPAIRPFHVYSPDINPAIQAEFAHAVYRFGHSMLDDDVARTNVDPTTGAKSDNSLPLLNAFLNPPEFFNGGAGNVLTPEQAAGSIVMGSSDQVGNELDEFVSETLRNNLLGLPLDLPTINMTRAREAGVPPLNDVRRQIFQQTNDGQLAPYTSWSDFGQHLKHPESLINFVAAYGTHPSIRNAGTANAKRAAARAIVNPQPAVLNADGTVKTPADEPPADASDFMFSTGAWASDPAGVTTTGLDDVDLWVGGLAEITNLFGGLLGSTFNYVFQTQMESLQDGDRFYYLARTPGMNLRSQLEGNSFSEMIHRNTDGTNSLKADPFATADCKFQLGNLTSPAAAGSFITGAGSVTDDPATGCDENRLLLKQPNGTIQYRQVNSVDPPGINGQAVYNGTDGSDRVFGGNDNDTFWGGLGRDFIEGNGGDDVALGGLGDDIETDLSGADVMKGGPGNDAIDGGIGDDIFMGGSDQDFINGGANDNETFAGPGDDFVIAGQGADAVFGDGGDDWIEGGSGQDLLQGDHGAPFFDDPAELAPGNDVFVGQVGENDYDAEGGDDIMAQNPAIDRNAGAGGFDWAIHQYDTVGADDDLLINQMLAGLPLPVVVNRDRWQETEADSGSDLNDTMRGDDMERVVGGFGFSGCDALDPAGVARISGLEKLVTAFPSPLQPIFDVSPTGFCPLVGSGGTAGKLGSGNVWAEGNILLGGGGSDLVEGRGNNDIIDGDHALSVGISVRNPANHAAEIGRADLMEHQYLRDATGALTGPTLQAAVFAGTVNPGDLVAVRGIDIPAGSPTPKASTAGDCPAPSTDGTVHLLSTTKNCDTALYSQPPDAYTITPNADGSVTVTDTAFAAAGDLFAKGDGIDTLWNIENLRFCTANDPVTGKCTTFTDTPLAVPSAPVIGTPVAGDGTATVRFTPGPANGAPATTGFRVQVFAGSTLVTTVSGIPANAKSTVVSGLTNGTAYTFRVIAVNKFGDSLPSNASIAVTPSAGSAQGPRVTASTPDDGATGVDVGADLTLSFNKQLALPATVTTTAVRLRTAAGNNVGALITYNDAARTITVNPTADLANDTSYVLTLLGTGGNGIRDLAGNRLPTTTVRFTTSRDLRAPAVTTTTPTDAATGVAVGANQVVNFSERVLGVSTDTVLLQANGAAPVTAVLTMNAAGTRVTVNPTVNLARNTVYSLTLTGGDTAIRDVAGNALGTRTITFRTAP